MTAERLSAAWRAGSFEEALALAAAAPAAEIPDVADALERCAALDGSERGAEAARLVARLRASLFPAGSAPAIEAEAAIASWALRRGRPRAAAEVYERLATTLEGLAKPAPDATAAMLYRLALAHRSAGDLPAEERSWRRALHYALQHRARTRGALSYPLGELADTLRRQGRAAEAAEVDRRIAEIPARLRR